MIKVIVTTMILATSFACSNTNQDQQDVTTKKLFYMVSPNFHKGPDFPGTASVSSPKDFFNIIKANKGKAFFLGTFTLAGNEGYFLTTAIVYTKDGSGMKGWNIIKNRGNNGKLETRFFSKVNGVTPEIVLDGALYLVATEVSLEATRENIDAKKLDVGLLRPSFDYLRSLL